jgi:hypothetical protein
MTTTLNYVTGARHEMAHALAYIAHDIPFASATLEEHGTGEVTSIPTMQPTESLAKIATAGQVIDLNVLRRRHGDGVALAQRLEGWRESVGDPEAEWSDAHIATGSWCLPSALPWALAFAETNFGLIAEAGDALIEAGGFLTYETVNARFAAGVQQPADAAMRRARELLAPYTAAIIAVEIAALTRRA